MSYLVLARKYRPTKFSEVTGQVHVTRTLSNSIKRDEIAHAYLFSGPRGVGKTSIARILSKELNCKNKIDQEVCGECVCKEIAEGRSLAVREIDGASHNSVDNIRELIESFRSVPPIGYTYKVYIIDEVHMLSTSAFNALLKSLEEPPPNTVFILATTEFHKIPDTVASRCQIFQFRALSEQEIRENISSLISAENLDLEKEVVSLIARVASGSLRDAQSLLDRVKAFSPDSRVTQNDATEALGLISEDVLFSISSSTFNREPDALLTIFEDIFSKSINPSLFFRDIVRHFRELLFGKVSSKANLLKLGFSEDHISRLQRQVAGVDLVDLQDILNAVRMGLDNALRSNYSRYALEALFVRVATREPVRDLAKIIASDSQIKTSKVKKLSTTNATSEKTIEKKKRSVVRKEVIKTSEQSAIKINNQSNLNEKFVWSEFLDFSCQNITTRLIGEQLKRCSFEVAENNKLKLTSSKFIIQFLQKAENKNKLIELLNQFSGNDNWQTSFIEAEVQVQQKEVQHVHVSKSEQELLSHPVVDLVKKGFPGTSIEVSLKRRN